VLQQTFASYEIILADNGSTDTSLEVALGVTRNIRVASFSRNLGYTGANNLAAKMARGAWLIFLNNDTKLAPDFLETLNRAALRRPDAHILVPTVASYDASHDGEIFRFGLDILGYPVQLATGEPFWGHGCALTVRRDAFISLGGFDDDYFIFYEEADFCWRAQITGHNVVGVPEAVVHHFGGGTVGNVTISNGRIATSANRRYLSERNRLSTLLKNYNTRMLVGTLVIYAMMTTAATLVLAATGQWTLVNAYVRALQWHLRHIQTTRRKRRFVQCLRTRDDLYVVKRMYRGLRELELFAHYGLPRTSH
jgi:GT2 family glycosyltransferase